MEVIIVIIIVGCAVVYCGIGLRKVLTGKKKCSCSSSPNGCNGCPSAIGGCGISESMDSNSCNANSVERSDSKGD